MDTDPNLLLALLAVRLLGGHAAPAGAEAIKALKKFVKDATDKGLLKEDTVTETVPVEGGKPKSKKVAVIALTEAGEQALRKAASSETLSATQSGHLHALRHRLEADLEALKGEVKTRLAASGKGEKDEDKVTKELGKLSQAVHDLVGKVGKLEGLSPKSHGESVLTLIEQGYGGLKTKLEQALHGLTSVVGPALTPKPSGEPAKPHETAKTHEAPKPHDAARPAASSPSGHTAAPAHTAPKPAPAPAPKPAESPRPAHPPQAQTPAPATTRPEPASTPAPSGPPTMAGILHKAYDTLKKLPQYQEANVDLPRLFHEACRAKPDLTVKDFHHELLALEDQRALNLSFHPDAKHAPEADKGLDRHGKLCYYVYWYRG